MKKLSATVCAVTHAGRIRTENEDNYSLNGRLTYNGDLKKGSAFVQKMTEPFHLAVCDGMGGESYGELASGIAVETLAKNAEDVYESGEDFSFAISNTLNEANDKICNEITARGARMGTTLAAIYAVKGSVICVNIGDTRIYHFSKGMLEQISFDHTHAQSIVDAGGIPQAKMGSIPDAKRLTKHLGVFPHESNLSPNISVIDDVDDGDVIMLCTDGLTDMIADSDIAEIISKGESPQDVSGKLIRKALGNGGKDNVTVITAFISAEETAIFAPIAAAMVGDKDADYEDEYINSYGSSKTMQDVNKTSPYAKADARAYVKPKDKKKIIKITAIVLAALVAALGVGLLVKAVLDKKKENDNRTTSPVMTTYNFGEYTMAPVVSELTTWNITVVNDPSAEETSETEKQTDRTTKKSDTPTRRRDTEKTTGKSSTTTRHSTTTHSTTHAETTTKAQETTEKTEVTPTEAEPTEPTSTENNTPEPSGESED